GDWSSDVCSSDLGDVAFVGSDGKAQMQVLFELLAEGGNDAGRTVAGVEAADAAGKVDVAIAIHVFDDGSFSARGENGRGVGRAARDGGFGAGQGGAGVGAGNFRAGLDGFD